MCGIFATNNPDVGTHNLEQINARLKFRGPDSQSDLVQCGAWKLYHSRLSIIAPSEEFSQPYRSETGGLIVFNGEILNFHELLVKHGLQQLKSDTAALMSLLDHKAFDLSEIDGFFAFVRVDRSGNLTHCARDRFGVKPLYLYRDGPYITVSSEASILSDLFNLSYSQEALEEYRVFRAPLFAGSFFKGVETVQPGTCIVTGIFFEPIKEFGQSYITSSEVQDQLEKVLKDAICSRMVSDVPVGLLFSGGIDSNLLFSLCDIKLQRFTGGFEGDYDLEFVREESASSVPNGLSLIKVTDAEFRQRFIEMVTLRKEPLSVPNEVILSFLAQAWSNQGGKVLISGEAADEFFAGYDRIFKWAAEAKCFDLDRFIDLYCYTPISAIPERLKSEMSKFFISINFLSPFEMVRYFFITKHLPVLFRRLDFALMFSGVEGREPFASYSVFKLAIQCSPAYLFQDDLGKLPLRLLASKKINTAFAFSHKIGFPVDIGRIFRNIPSIDKYDNYELWTQENLGLL
jgi:asparagine synthase (glutamine-hydrolysing)